MQTMSSILDIKDMLITSLYAISSSIRTLDQIERHALLYGPRILFEKQASIFCT